MKKYLLIATVLPLVFITATLLTSCDSTEKVDKNLSYISNDTNECKKILYNCPQYQESFTDEKGCGCKPSGDTKDNVESRSMDQLITKYLKEKMIEPANNGKIQAEFARTGSQEVDNILKYDVYAVIEEFYMKDNKIAYGSKKEGIFQIKIEETGKNYIIRDYLFVDPATMTDDQKKSLSSDTISFLGKKDVFDKNKERIQTIAKQMGAISFGRTMEDFEDYVAPSTQESTQQTGNQSTQQSTRQN